MFPHYHAVSISTPVHSVTLGLPCRSLWLQLWAHLWCNPDWPSSTPLCMDIHKLHSAQNSLTRVVLPFLRHLSASERLSYLHWLPVHYWIQFTITTLTYYYNSSEEIHWITVNIIGLTSLAHQDGMLHKHVSECAGIPPSGLLHSTTRNSSTANVSTSYYPLHA